MHLPEGIKSLFLWGFLGLLIATVFGSSPFDWMKRDAIDEIYERMDMVTAENCRSKPDEALKLDQFTVTQEPRANQLLSQIIFANRTRLLHLHNMALNRAMYWSYILQKLNETDQRELLPTLRYYLYSLEADVAANQPYINGSGIFYNNNLTFPNWYQNINLNETIPLFGPRAYRADDYDEPSNWLREPTNLTNDITDYGAGFQSNYTDSRFKGNQWYYQWLATDKHQQFPYEVMIKHALEPGKYKSDIGEGGLKFYGPNAPKQATDRDLPVRFTQPYFDCGRSNKWIVSATSPVVDRFAKYTEFEKVRHYKHASAISIDTDFLQIDINPCPKSEGNNENNKFVNTARCKRTTMCQPLPGWGFRRGGYQCACRPGFRYPEYQLGPFLGRDIEMATEEEYNSGFECLPVNLRKVIPVREGLTITEETSRRGKRSTAVQLAAEEQEVEEVIDSAGSRRRQYFVPRYASGHSRMRRAVARNRPRMVARKHLRSRRVKRQQYPGWANPRFTEAFDAEAISRSDKILEDFGKASREGACVGYSPEHIFTLPGDSAYGADVQFEPQGRTALRLANFLSNYLQTVDPEESFGLLKADKRLNTDQLFGEVIGNVMGDNFIVGAGVFFDTNKFIGATGKYGVEDKRELFGPYAYQHEETGTTEQTRLTFRADDVTGEAIPYTSQPWFKSLKYRWGANTHGLKRYTTRAMIREDSAGIQLRRFEHFPMHYYAAEYEDGEWFEPQFKCDRRINKWTVTYAVPFFGKHEELGYLEFKGVVTVDVLLQYLNINQCPSDFFTPNAFKGTARCFYDSTYCVPLEGRRFDKGGYKCECKQGYEYPFIDNAWYFDGKLLESEFEKLTQKHPNRFFTMNCRLAGASNIHSSLLLILFALFLAHRLSSFTTSSSTSHHSCTRTVSSL